jgi:hypothetical protein
MKDFVLCTTTIKEISITRNTKSNDNIYLDQLGFKDNSSELDNTAVPSPNGWSTNASVWSASGKHECCLVVLTFLKSHFK